jgi:hypothetical protein
MAEGVYTAPLAIVKVGGVAIGKMKTIQVNENIQRGTVQGLGELTPQEKPALVWAGTLSCGFYTITWQKSSIPNAITRNVNTLKEFVDSLLLQEQGVTVELYKKIRANGAPTIGLIPSSLVLFCTISGLFLEGDNFDISEGSISGKNQSFSYLDPVIFPR